ncbi:hypothetical protein PC129_g5132 [Phytophthora cactorum]|uniref:Uncharacterized protein n=1 Tax=Phytophthora cactorum TaxID=29920 RepID=A0A329SCA3_9STRA|nr:hypothetical protein Pcac1_g21075 [Phytophthora cactorum]KAG2809646.1 hypothetical protein PC112_g16414 [Phytophthora cactorum]KAG2833783.1 hypothetical protein PC111_g6098 [Phytophthora cactorum]KAG2865225.1 hypothetical protein PC113_g3902 [Phytophthora cactorum]KAG2886843.1 hypothetical protein PC115_g20554 [Phytophthora cactorum]
METTTSRLQSLSVEKDLAVHEADLLRKSEEMIQQEMTTLRLDNTDLLNLMESTRRMETGREECGRREVETLTKKVTTLQTHTRSLTSSRLLLERKSLQRKGKSWQHWQNWRS